MVLTLLVGSPYMSIKETKESISETHLAIVGSPYLVLVPARPALRIACSRSVVLVETGEQWLRQANSG